MVNGRTIPVHYRVNHISDIEHSLVMDEKYTRTTSWLRRAYTHQDTDAGNTNGVSSPPHCRLYHHDGAWVACSFLNVAENQIHMIYCSDSIHSNLTNLRQLFTKSEIITLLLSIPYWLQLGNYDTFYLCLLKIDALLIITHEV